MREFATKVDVARPRAPGRHRRHRRRRVAHVQHLDRVDVRRGGGRRARRQARQPLGVVEVGQRRRARGARRQHHADARRRSRSASRETGVGFMFAPNHHAAMKHAAPVRRELGVRTIFNILGPLTNPAGAPNQLIGVFHPDLVGIHVRVLQRLGAQARARRVRHGRHGRGVARRGDDGRRAEGRRGPRVRDPSGGLRAAR